MKCQTLISSENKSEKYSKMLSAEIFLSMLSIRLCHIQVWLDLSRLQTFSCCVMNLLQIFLQDFSRMFSLMKLLKPLSVKC